LNGAVRAIEDFFCRRYGREALFVPSGRFGLYLAFREWLRPGDRLLLSPVTDDVVLFTILAAGLVPVLGPIDPATGNLDPAAIPDSDWDALNAVMTTNLYGIPDRMDLLTERCRRHGLLLIEDACQALDSRFGGRWIGQLGSVAVHSLTKHFSGAGGVVTFSDASRRPSLIRRIRQELRPRPLPRRLAHWARPLLDALRASNLGDPWLDRLRARMLGPSRERSGHRLPYEAGQVRQSRKDGGGLDRFDRWVKVDNADYRIAPRRAAVRATLRELENFEENRRRRLAGALKLLELGLTPPELPIPPDTALFRVPLFVRDREKVLAHFAEQGLAIDYIYDPPLDLYAPELVERIPSPPAARMWSCDVLPVDPFFADRFLALLRQSPGLCRPALETVHSRGGGDP
jgi:DegT/DnrJ/EryC1/StrS aminotransferase family protein